MTTEKEVRLDELALLAQYVERSGMTVEPVRRYIEKRRAAIAADYANALPLAVPEVEATP